MMGLRNIQSVLGAIGLLIFLLFLAMVIKT